MRKFVVKKIESRGNKINQNNQSKQFQTSGERQSTNWDIQNAGKNYFTLVASQVGLAVFSFASVWLVTQYLGAEGYGRITALLLATQLAQIPIMWTGNALSRYGVQEFVETGKITKTFWARTAILIPNLLLMVILSPFWLPSLTYWLKLPPEFSSLLVLNLAITAFWMHVQYSLQGGKLPRLQSVLMMSERVLIFLLLIGLAISGRLSLFAVIWGYTIAPLFMTIIGLWKLKPLLSGIILESARFKKIIIFSLPIPLYSVLGHLTFNHLDAIFILRYLTTADLGVYSVAYQLNGLVVQLSYLVGSLVMPLLVTSQTHNQEQVRNSYFQDVLPLLTFGFGVLSVTFAIIAYCFLPFILNENFIQVGSLLFIFTAACAVSVPVQAGFLPLAYSESVTYIQLIAATIAATANIAFNFLLIPKFGLVGCVWATIISYTFNMLVFAVLMGRKFDLPYLTTILTPLPIILGAAIFTWYGNVVISFLVVFCSGFILLFAKRNSFLKGYQKLQVYRQI